MYKVKISVLEGVIKQLKASNKVLGELPKSPAITKLINSNEKQIKEIKDEYYID